MSAWAIVRAWRRCVAADLLPHLHGHQAHALADFSYAIALAGHCQAGQVASHVPTDAKPASARRRFERLLANERLLPQLAQSDLARAVLAPWAGLTVRLVLDETPKANDLRPFFTRLASARGTLPLATLCSRFGSSPPPLPELVRELLHQVLACLPANP